jgi:hypothetical protein
MARGWLGSWAGGRVGALKNGKRRWVLERRWRGRQHSIPLPTVRDDEGALAALYSWQHDPAGFLERVAEKRRRDQEQAETVCRLDEEALAAVQVDMTRRQLTVEHRRDVMLYLRRWQEDLGSVDLRHVTRLQAQRALDSHPTARKQRVAALKTLGALLVRSGWLDASATPGRHCEAPKAPPERSVRTKGYSAASLQAAYALTPDSAAGQRIRDTMR